eukprot:22450_1
MFGTHKCQKSPSSKSLKKFFGAGKPFGNVPTTSNPVDSPHEYDIDVATITNTNSDGTNFAYLCPGSFGEFIHCFINNKNIIQHTDNIIELQCECGNPSKNVINFSITC